MVLPRVRAVAARQARPRVSSENERSKKQRLLHHSRIHSRRVPARAAVRDADDAAAPDPDAQRERLRRRRGAAAVPGAAALLPCLDEIARAGARPSPRADV